MNLNIKKLIFIVLAWLAVVSFAGSAFMFIMLDFNRDNGRVVNYSGVVRGSAQRIAKLHMLGQPVDDIAANLEKIVDALIDGDESLEIPKARNQEFIDAMNEVRTYWHNDLKEQMIHEPGEHDVESFYKKSEVFFSLTDEAVSIAEENSVIGITNMKIVTVIIFFINLSCIIIIGAIVNRRVLKPLKLIEKGVAQVAEGDLSAQISYRSNDELGMLAESMRIMISNMNSYIKEIQYQLSELSKGNLDITIKSKFNGDFVAIENSLISITASLNEIMSNIGESAEQVAISSSYVSSSVQSLAENAEEEVRSMEILTSKVSDISKQVGNTAENADKADKMVQKVSESIRHCGECMQEMVCAMEKISKSSAGIEKVTKTIEDISFQTNLLALNASVEAARAGTAGKGFAVVADEVRALANKSGSSVKGTDELVKDSMTAVKNGTEIVTQTSNMLKEVVLMAHEVSEAVASINEATAEQSKSIEEVMFGIQQITDSVHSSSATTEESAASSEELSGQADILKNLVGRFKLRTLR